MSDVELWVQMIGIISLIFGLIGILFRSMYILAIFIFGIVRRSLHRNQEE